LACAQQQPGQEKDPNFSQAVLVASAATAPATTTIAVPAPAPAPPPSASGFSWTGPYVGVTFGYASANAATFVNPLPTAAVFVNLAPQTLSQDPTGLLGGGELGYNWQRGHFVLGPEADISAAGIDGTKTVAPITQNNGTPFPGAGNHITVNQRTDALSTVRGRLGFTLGSRVLVYGTGGLAIGHVGYTANTDFRPVGTEQYIAAFSKTKTGWTGGGGVEFAVGKGFTARAEYLHYNLGSQSFTANPSIPFPPSAPPFQVAYTWNDATANVVRFGFGFKF
jgi:outer membrane immunogenic protein